MPQKTNDVYATPSQAQTRTKRPVRRKFTLPKQLGSYARQADMHINYLENRWEKELAKEKAAIRKEMDKELKAEKRKVREEMKKSIAKQKQSAAAAKLQKRRLLLIWSTLISSRTIISGSSPCAMSSAVTYVTDLLTPLPPGHSRMLAH